MDATKMIAQGLVTARLDYGNGLLLGTMVRNLDQLQVAWNAIATAVCQAPRSFSATDLRVRTPGHVPKKTRWVFFGKPTLKKPAKKPGPKQ